jgi:DNA-binding FadR family transcriptional regulator
MARILDMCGDLLSYTRQATLLIPGQPQKSLEDHQGIFEAIRAKDEKTASLLMVEHLMKAQRNLEDS